MSIAPDVVAEKSASGRALLNERRPVQRTIGLHTCPAVRGDCQPLFTSVARQRAHATAISHTPSALLMPYGTE